MSMVSLLFHDVYRQNPSESGFTTAAADRYKLSLDQFEAELRGLAAARQDAPVVCDGGAGRLPESTIPSRVPFAITVDDGGVSYSLVADHLEALGWRGHSFVTTGLIGHRGFLTARQIRDLDARGHVIGTHSVTHPPRFSACSLAEMQAEWSRSRATLEDLLGHAVTTASVPGGYFSATVARAARAAGIRVLFTSEPTTRTARCGTCLVIGRFTIRPTNRLDVASRIVLPPAFTRRAQWAGWNAKKVIKPLLGSTYSRVADWLLAPPRP